MTQTAAEIRAPKMHREHHDAYLPYLSQLLDIERMTEVFLGALFPTRTRAWIASDCKLERLKYKPAKNCLAVYTFEARNCQNGKSEAHRVSCRTYEKGGSLRRYHKALRENNGEPTHRAAVFHVPDLELVGWVFPYERKLFALPFISNHHYLQHVLMPKLLRQFCGETWHLRKMNSAVIHYVPEHTCIVKVSLELGDSTSVIKHRQVYGKCYYNDEGAQTYRIMRRLAAQSTHKTTPLKFPAPLYYDASNRILWQQGLTGQTLRDAGVSSRQDTQLLALAGRSIAQFHQLTPPTGLTITGVKEVLALLELRRQLLKSVQTLDQKLLRVLVMQLNDAQSRLRNDPPVTLHGDVHPQNLFVLGDNIAFIDLDNVALGSPLLDLASWIGGMVYWAAMQKTHRATLLERIRAFIAAYSREVPDVVDNQSLSWYLAAALINERVFRCITRMKSGRLMIVNDLLVYAQEFAKNRHRLVP